MLGFITSLLGGGGLSGVTSAVKGVAEVFTENKEAAAGRKAAALDRDTEVLIAAQAQFAREFHRPRNIFDSIINGLNRLPRPILALGAIGVLGYAFYDPVRFQEAAIVLEIVPEELWWLISAIVAFYFGARHFEKRKGMATDIALVTEFLNRREKQTETKSQGDGADKLFEG